MLNPDRAVINQDTALDGASKPSSVVNEVSLPSVIPLGQGSRQLTRSIGGKSFDRLLHAWQARWTGSLSGISLTLAYLDWFLHLANAPERRLALALKAGEQLKRLASPVEWTQPAAEDHRFRDEAWTRPPFNQIAQAFLLTEEWWKEATSGLPGVAKSHTDVVSFDARQLLDIFSPSNIPWINPEILQATLQQALAAFGEDALPELSVALAQQCPAGRPRQRALGHVLADVVLGLLHLVAVAAVPISAPIGTRRDLVVLGMVLAIVLPATVTATRKHVDRWRFAAFLISGAVSTWLYFTDSGLAFLFGDCCS